MDELVIGGVRLLELTPADPEDVARILELLEAEKIPGP